MSPSPAAALPDLVAAAFARRRAGGGWTVDAFAGADLQRAALRGGAADGAALAADGSRTVLAEEDPGLLLRVEADLARAGRAARRTDDPASCAPGEVALVEAAAGPLLGRLLPALGEGPLLLRMAPLSARALPWPLLERAAAHAGAELLLRLPAEDFTRQGRFAGPLADLPPHLRRAVEACSALLDDPRHGWIGAWREAERSGGAAAALLGVAERLAARLAAALPDLLTRVAAVDGVPLLLCTRDPAALLELNGALRDAGVPAGPPAPDPAPEAPARSAADAPLDLFPLPPAPAPDAVPRLPDPAAVAERLHGEHRGSTVPLASLVASLAESGLAPEDLRAALGLLKRAGRAAYGTLDDEGAEVGFLADPAPPPSRARRTPRRPAAPDLFDPPTE